jgi:hypothetical protein
MYADVVDANMENRRLKRALYKVCDNWAVCDGVLIERKDYGSHYSFVCKDGKVLRELTNFRVEELHK